MGLVERILKPTPLYSFYKNILKRKALREQEKLESKLHPLRVQFYSHLIKPGDLVFDVGANVGNRVLSFLECGAKVIAVEPQPYCVNILKRKFANKIVIENVGLGETEGELEMHIATDTTVSSFNNEYIESTKERFKYTQWVDKIKVPIKTLDILIKEYSLPQFCKIDVEGYELEVLKGLNYKVPIISIEYCVPEMHQQLNDCVNRLRDLSPEGVFNYSVGESMIWAQKSWMNYESFIEHISTEQFLQSSFGDIYFKSV